MESPTVPVGGKKEVSAADVAQVLGKTGSLIGRTVTRIRIFFQSGEWVSRETLGQKGNWDLPHLASICDAYDKAIGGKKNEKGTPQMEKLRTQKESKYEAAVRGRAPFTDEDVTELKDLLEGTFPYEGLQFSATSPEGYSEKYQVYRAHKSVFITREKTGESIRLYEKNIHRRLKGNEWSPPRGSEQEDLLVRTWSDVFRTALEAARKFAYVKKEWASFIDNFQGTSTQFYIEHSPQGFLLKNT